MANASQLLNIEGKETWGVGRHCINDVSATEESGGVAR